MGIDIYMRWKLQTEEEEKAQYTGFSVTAGKYGYLREAYHGEPYATRYLVAEAFNRDGGEDGTAIPAKVLRERLPHTLKLVEQRERELYHETKKREIDKVKASFTAFVELAERKEAETGEPVKILASY